MPVSRCRILALLCLSVTWPAALCAQTAPPEPAPPGAEKRVFTPAEFARFAPRTAYDLLVQLPSFTLRFADDARGLGQASENVLINGERANDKSGGAIERLRNVPTGDVIRIEVQEAAGLGIAGLTGQVANVILKDERKASGRFTWSPRVRPDYAKPLWTGGSISYAGTTGKLDYTFSLQNNAGRGAIGGMDYVVRAPDGAITERRDQLSQFVWDGARMSTQLKYGGKGPVQANLNLTYTPYWQTSLNAQRRERGDGGSNDWLTRGSIDGYSFAASGDLAFPLLSGTLKLIGLRRYEHAPSFTTQTTDFDSATPDTGTRFGRDSRTSETIGRAEYHRKIGVNDFELSLERAYNKLDQRGSLATLQSDGSFLPVDFPQGSGIVAETRYEGVLSLSRPITAKLDLQMVVGAEFSQLAHLDRTEPAREFFRPKGSVSLAWHPAMGWDGSLKLERKVGQISFYDFLAQPDLVLDRGNDANPDLVPPQSWQLTAELGRDFGAWGKTRLKTYAHRIDDIVDFIPIGTDGQAVGNLPRATRLGLESKSTIQFDPIGWKGAKLDMTIGAERSRVRDPLTGADRPISNTHDMWVALNLRHDIPGSQIAWGAGFYHDHYGSSYYLTEINRGWEGPYTSIFIEHKNLLGLKTRLEVFNLFNERNHFDRTVFGGRRNVSPILFREQQNQHVSQIITLSITGTF